MAEEKVAGGFLDKQGKISIAPRYMFVRPFHEGLAAVETDDGTWIYINTSGKTVMKGAPADFFNGLACMGDRFIDKKGETVIEIPQGYSLESSTQNGFDNFYLGDLIVVYEEQNGQKAIMNKQGKIILESNNFDDMKIFRDNYVAVKKNGMWGIINLDKH